MTENKVKMGARGQLYSTDALLAFVVFAFALMLISGLTNQLENQFVQTTAQEYGRLAATRVAESLLASPGDPVYWENLADRNAIFRAGLAAAGNEISIAKWNAFLDWNAADYPSLKNRLGLADKDFYITLADVNRIVLTRAGTGPTDSNNVALVMLPAVYRGVPVILHLQVYSR